MKNFRFPTFILLIAVLISACGPTQIPQPSRQEQLSPTGIFDRHPLIGVSVSNGTAGSFSGGFFVLAALANGEISPSTSITLQWKDSEGSSFYTVLQIGMIKVTPVVGQENTQVLFDFKDVWLSDGPSFYRLDDTSNLTVDGNDNILFTEGSKLNPNNFIKEVNLDIVEIFINPELLTAPTIVLP